VNSANVFLDKKMKGEHIAFHYRDFIFAEPSFKFSMTGSLSSTPARSIAA